MKRILLVGYGRIGKKIFEDYKEIITGVCDTSFTEQTKETALKEKVLYSSTAQLKGAYDLCIICVPDSQIISVVQKVKADVYLVKSTPHIDDFDKMGYLALQSVVFSPEFKSGQSNNGLEGEKFTILGGMPASCSKVQELIQICDDAYHRYFHTDIKTAIAVKYAENATLALLVTWWNELYRMCEKNYINYNEFRNLLTLDPRIPMSHSLHQGQTYNSHCLNKDIPYMEKLMGEEHNLLTTMRKYHDDILED